MALQEHAWPVGKALVCSWNHRTTESFRLEKTFKITESPTINLTLPSPPLNYIPKRHVYTSFYKYVQGWWLHHFHGQPVPILTTLLVKKCFLTSNLNLPWHNLRPFPPVLWWLDSPSTRSNSCPIPSWVCTVQVSAKPVSEKAAVP